ncbi:MAG: LysR family transcriptional regulator [Rickettsiales bacterium]|nr:LysR family transcriptional regulator [Rickettsiales bacterium]
MDWDKLRIFYTVGQAKSLTKAGESLSLSQSAVSRQISALEEKLQTKLFHRHARGLLLTEQGEILFRTVSDMVTKLHATETQLAESSTKPRGSFTITAPVAIGSMWLAPTLKEFSQMYPDIDITLLIDDRELDLAMREADVAIRLLPSKHPDLIQKPLMSLSNSVFASNDYLREHGIPKSLDDLQRHHIIGYANNVHLPFPGANWLMDLPEVKRLKLTPRIRINSINSIRRAVKVGMGIAALPDYMMYRSRHISKVLTDIEGPMTEAYFVYPLELKNSRRVSVFKSFINRKLSEFNF